MEETGFPPVELEDIARSMGRPLGLEAVTVCGASEPKELSLDIRARWSVCVRAETRGGEVSKDEEASPDGVDLCMVLNEGGLLSWR